MSINMQEIAMRLNDLRVRATIFLIVLTASAFYLGRASKELEVGVGTSVTLLMAALGALAVFFCLFTTLFPLWKYGAPRDG